METEVRPVIWLGSTRRDLRAMPQQVRRDIGQALYAAQQGMTDPAAKPLKGFGGTRVMEIVERYRKDAYRAVYTAHSATAVYVLHVFEKKSKSGIATPKHEIELIRKRLAEADRYDKERQQDA
jgi:phage-related protein